MKVKEVIKQLEKLDPEMQVYIDCFHCDKALEITKLFKVVVMHTQEFSQFGKKVIP